MAKLEKKFGKSYCLSKRLIIKIFWFFFRMEQPRRAALCISFPIPNLTIFAHCVGLYWWCLTFKTKRVFRSQQQYKASDIPGDRSIVVVTCFIRRVFYYRSIEVNSLLHDQFELPKHDSDSCLLRCCCWHEPRILLQRVEWQPFFPPLLCRFSAAHICKNNEYHQDVDECYCCLCS